MATDLEAANEKLTILEDSNNDQQSDKSDKTIVENEVKQKNNIVDWDGPDDSENPMNWPTWKRIIQVVLASAFLLTA